jgi:hypothetical protein
MTKPVFTGTIPRGNTRVLTITVTGEGSGAPTDLSAYTDIRFLVKRSAADADDRAVITKTLEAADIVVSSPSSAGIATFTILADDTPVSIFTRTQAWPCGLRGYGSGAQVDDLIDNQQSTLTVTAGSVQATS